MIRRIRVKGYKSLRDCSIDLAPLTVILGPNGTGKSNLLDLIGLLSRLASRDTVREAFQGHRGRPLEAFHSASGFGRDAYELLLKEERLAFSVTCDLELHPGIVEGVNRTLQEREEVSGAQASYTRVTETRLRYEIEITLHPQSGEIFVTDEALRALRHDLEPKDRSARSPFLETEHLDSDIRFVARLERQGHPRFFDSERGRTLLSELSDPVYHPHVVAAAREIASWRVYYVEPNRMRESAGVLSAEEPGRSGELLAPYYYFLQQKHPVALKGIIRSLQGLVPHISDLRVDMREGAPAIVTIGANGSEWPTRLLSEGTLRLLSILGIVVAPSPPALVGFEEPENGVNPSRLDEIAQVVRNAVELRHHGMQFIVTTHSSYLCDLLPEHLVRCHWTERDGTSFSPLPWDPDSLYFEEEIREALDAAGRSSGGV